MTTVVRALRHRAASALLVGLITLVAVAAATVGPTYYDAARASILTDHLAAAPALGRGVELTEDGELNGVVDGLASQASAIVNRYLGSQQRRILQPAIESVQTPVSETRTGESFLLVWRTGACAHLHLLDGRCPRRAGEVAASAALLRRDHYSVGQRISPQGFSAFRVVGSYQPADDTLPYWFAHAAEYFPIENPESPAHESGLSGDAMFTVKQTFANAPVQARGRNGVDLLVDPEQARPADVDGLRAGADALITDQGLSAQQVIVQTDLPATVAAVHHDWSTLGVPVLVVTAELLVLAWLLLFVTVVDAVEARASEIALVRLRGHSGWATLRFALAEPTAVLLASLPLGALLGWWASRLMGHALLRPGTSVPLPGMGWLAALLATGGGFLAVLVASRRAVRRPIVEQWQRTGRHAGNRGWVLDAVVATAAAVGLVQLVVSGSIGSTGNSPLALLVPGVLGLAVAIVASRLLPLGCRAGYRWTRHHGGVGGFLALRTVARRPGGTRTTMTLATALALATFGVLSFSIAHSNRHRVAAAQTGAATVLTVDPPSGGDLATVVDDIDPSGRHAAAVLVARTSGATSLAVQPQRFAAVANWPRQALGRPPAAIPRLIEPVAPTPVALNGTALRVRLTVDTLAPAGARLRADVIAGNVGQVTPVDLGPLRRSRRPVTMTGGLVGCPCRLVDFAVSSSTPSDPRTRQPAQVRGRLAIQRIELRDNSGWRPVPVSGNRWSAAPRTGSIVVNRGVLEWTMQAPPNVDAAIRVDDHPQVLPAVVTPGVNAANPPSGLDGAPLAVRAAARARLVPGLPQGPAAVVDLDYALLAAGSASAATDQVWVASGEGNRIVSALAARRVHVTHRQDASSTAASFDRQGPGLANVLFLFDAGAAALLAVVGAIVAVAVAARRRRHELTALLVVGARPRSLRTGVLVEQLLVLGYGALVGIGTGMLAIAVALRALPEFATRPPSLLLSYAPSGPVVVWIVAAAVLLVGVTGLLVSVLVVRSLDPTQLREDAA